MPLVSFEKVLKIILTILNVLSAALRAFGYSDDHHDDSEDESSEGHS